MTQEWTISGKKLSDFNNLIDWEIASASERMAIVQFIAKSGADFFGQYFTVDKYNVDMSNLEFIRLQVDQPRALEEDRRYMELLQTFYVGDGIEDDVFIVMFDESEVYKYLEKMQTRRDNDQRITEKMLKKEDDFIRIRNLLEKDSLKGKEKKELKQLKEKHFKRNVDSRYRNDRTKRKFFDPNLGTQSEMKDAKKTSEFDPVSKVLERLVTYLIFCEENKQAFNEKEQEIKFRQFVKTARRMKEYQYEEPSLEALREKWHEQENYELPTRKTNYISQEVDVKESDRIFTAHSFPKGEHESKFPKFINIDRSECRNETENKMTTLLFELGQNKRMLNKMITDGSIDKKTKYKIHRWVGDIKKNENEIKKSRHRPIYLRMLLKSTTVINFDRDTGYMKDEEYVHVSHNKFDFAESQHMAGIIENYKYLRDYEHDTESDLYYILQVFRESIERADLSASERDMLKWHLDDDLPITTMKNEPLCDTIIDKLLSEHGEKRTQSYVSKFFTDKAPKQISEAFRDWKEDWTYTYKLKGKYKQCSKCKQVKLICKFGKNKNYKDGYNGSCKVCK